MVEDVVTIAEGLSRTGYERHRRAVLAADANKWQRAGDIAPGRGPAFAQGFFRDSGLFERRFYVSHLQYRLTPLGKLVKAHLETKPNV